MVDQSNSSRQCCDQVEILDKMTEVAEKAEKLTREEIKRVTSRRKTSKKADKAVLALLAQDSQLKQKLLEEYGKIARSGLSHSTKVAKTRSTIVISS